MGRTRTSIVCRAIIGFSFALAYPAIADTIVGGIISTDTVWSLDGSPYIAEQSVLVVGGATLRIEPGVEVRFGPDRALSINEGTLVAMGTAASNILFAATAFPPDVDTNRWGYIGFGDQCEDATFDSGGSWQAGSVLRHCIIVGAGGTELQGAVHINSASPLVEMCSISNCVGGGIFIIRSQGVVIRNNRIQANRTASLGGGISLDDSDNVLIDGNIILSNEAIFGGGIYLTRSMNAEIVSNVISSNRAIVGGGIHLNGTDYADLYSNHVYGNFAEFGGGISLISSHRCAVKRNSICANTASDSGGGLRLFRANNTEIWGGEIVSNSAPQGAIIVVSDSQYTRLNGSDYEPVRIVHRGRTTGSLRASTT
jgi:parallel beta-helix repeat protein